jgi:hypothetical protein
MVGIVIGAGILGLIIAVMERGEFPGWGKMAVCVLAAAISAFVINALLPPELFLIGLAIGAVCAGVAIAWTCGMSVQRSFIAAAVYFAIQCLISVGFYFLTK